LDRSARHQPTAQDGTELPSMTSLLKKLRALQSCKCQFAI
jgi:hypothetical protein